MIAPEVSALRDRQDELTEAEIGTLLASGLGVIHTLHQEHGDKRETWDPDEADEVASARATFDSLRDKGYVVYRAEGRRGLQGEVMRTFDPAAGRLIAVKQNRGG
jgi:hypothetical protein